MNDKEKKKKRTNYGDFTDKSSSQKMGNVVYVSLGGGPLSLMGNKGHVKMVSFMKKLPLKFPKPDEIEKDSLL